MSHTTTALESLRLVGAKVLRIPPFMYPSEWASFNCWISGAENGTGSDTRIDPFYFPCNVGIMDAYAEGKRGVLVQKAVQMGVSQAEQMLCLYIVARVGGPTGYAMAKDETMREHALDRFDVNLKRSAELAALYLPGREDHTTIRSRRFLNATLKMFGSKSPNNFKSNPYLSFFADEFELMPVFPDGSDGVALAKGRQAAKQFPFFAGWSTPLEADSARGIEAAIKRDSDMRLFWWRCPHCKDAITVNFLDNVKFDFEPGSKRAIPGTSRLLCPKCGHVITDSERAVALVHAAKAACPWYSRGPVGGQRFEREPEDGQLGWISTLPPDEAAARPYCGFMGLDHLHSPHKAVAEIAAGYLAATSEPERKTFHNDVLGLGYTIRARQLTRGDISRCIAEARRSTIPSGTLWITFGADVQGGGPDVRRSVFYYDISAWVKTDALSIRKVTLFLDRLTSTDENGHETIKSLLRSWTSTDERGNTRRLDMACIDGTFRSATVNAICNTISGTGTQWCLPIVYGSKKPDDPDYHLLPQNETVGDPGKAFLLTTRSYLVGRYVNLITDERGLLELPDDTPEEVISHYLANEMVRKPNHVGIVTDLWKKREESGGRLRDDDWFAAGCYSMMGAIMLGFDQQQSASITEAQADADKVSDTRILKAKARSASEAARRIRMHHRLARSRGGG